MAGRYCYVGDYLGPQEIIGPTSQYIGPGIGYPTLKNIWNYWDSGYCNFMAIRCGAPSMVGSNNILIGESVGQFTGNPYNPGIGGCNIIMGAFAGRYHYSNDFNVALGANSGYYGCGSQYNVAIGYQAACRYCSACYDIAIGYKAGGFQCNTQRNINIGYRAGPAGLYGACGVNKNDDIAIGTCAGFYSCGMGANNIFIGCRSGGRCQQFNNIMMGMCAGACTIFTQSSIFLGWDAGTSNCGNNNIFIGSCAGISNAGGSGPSYSNIYMGIYAGQTLTTGGYNVGIGHNAGRYNMSATYSTMMGYEAGRNLSTGTNNVLIGNGANPGDVSNWVQIGNALITYAGVAVAWTYFSDIRDKCVYGEVQHGRSFLEGITPIVYSFKDRVSGCIREDIIGKKRYGFSAQNILAQEGDDPVIVDNSDPDKLRITADSLVPILVNAVKELSAELETLKTRVLALETN